MKWNNFSRRHFLQGAGGSYLMLPLLQSLLSEKVYAALAAGTQKNFIGIPGINGGYRSTGNADFHMRTVTNGKNLVGHQQLVLPTHTINSTSLSGYAAANGKISHFVSEKFNPYLRRMNMLQGLTRTTLTWSHNRGHFGGIHHESMDKPTQGLRINASIDQVMAASTNFYKNPSLQQERRFVSTYLPHSGGQNMELTNLAPQTPGDKLGTMQQGLSAFSSPLSVWNKYFRSTSPTTTRPPVTTTSTTRPPVTTTTSTTRPTTSTSTTTTRPPATTTSSTTTTTRPPVTTTSTTRPPVTTTTTTKPPTSGPVDIRQSVVDQVYLDYKNLLGNRRLGREDKDKIERHMSFMHEASNRAAVSTKLQQSIQQDMNQGATGTCNYPASPGTITERRLMMHAFNDLIVAMISCGMCHVFSHAGMGNTDNWTDEHNASHEFAHPMVLENYRILFEDVMLDLIIKLEAAGHADTSLVFLIPESGGLHDGDPTNPLAREDFGRLTHCNVGLPVAMWGDLGGLLKTDQYINYSDLTATLNPGFPIGQLHANILQAMDVPSSEYEQYNFSTTNITGTQYLAPFKPGTGFGENHLRQVDNNAWFTYNDVLPFYKRAGWANYDLNTWLPLLKA